MNSFVKSLFLVPAVVLAACSSPQTNKSSWSLLFDGKSTEALRGYKQDSFPDKGWKVENGTLKTIVDGEVVDLVTKEKFENFDLHLDWKISPGGNSGVMYHVSEEFPRPYNTGPEMQVLDDAKHADGKNPKTSAGALYALIAPKNKHVKPAGEWNHARLRVRGNHVEHWLNLRKVAEYDLGSKELNDLIVASKFKDMPRFAKEKSGHICLQHHHDEVWYRNIRINRL